MKTTLKRVSQLLVVAASSAMLAFPCMAAEAESQDAITFTDLAGQEITLDQPIEKAVLQYSGYGGPFITMCGLFGEDVCDHIAGWDDNIVNSADAYAIYTKAVPGLAEIPRIGDILGDTFDVEAVLTSGAQAVISAYETYDYFKDSVQPKLAEAGIPIIYVNFHAETLEKTTQSIEIIGKVFGEDERAQEMIDFYTGKVSPVLEKVEQLTADNERPVVYIENGRAGAGSKEFGGTYTNNNMWGGIVYATGGTSLAEGVVENYASIDPEYLLTADPDAILIVGQAMTPDAEFDVNGTVYVGFEQTQENLQAYLQAYCERPGWDSLKAVQENRISIVPHPIAREVYDCASIQAVAKAVWPEEFEDVDPMATIQEFYDTFLPFPFSGTWYEN